MRDKIFFVTILLANGDRFIKRVKAYDKEQAKEITKSTDYLNGIILYILPG